MANHKSALKRNKQTIVRQQRNRSQRTRIKNVIKAVDEQIAAGNAQEAGNALLAAQSVIDKGAASGIIHKNKAARKISRLARKIAAL